MNIYTYYQTLPLNTAIEDENLWLLDIWQKSWRYHGWNPIVLTLDDAKRNPLYQKFRDKCETYPTVNSREYETACYVRWLTMFDKSGWTTDFDIINYGFKPVDYKNKIVSLTGSLGGSTIFGPNEFYQNVIDTIYNYKFDEDVDFTVIDNEKILHVSDMKIMDKCLKPIKSIVLEKKYGLDGYESVPVVHYNNNYVLQMKTNRKTAISSDPRSKYFML